MRRWLILVTFFSFYHITELLADCNQEIFVPLQEDWGYQPGICEKFVEERVIGHLCDDAKDVKEDFDPKTGKIGCRLFCICKIPDSQIKISDKII